MCMRHMKIRGRPWLQSVPDFGPTYLGIVLLCIKVDAVGYPDEHVAVSDSVELSHSHADAVTSGVDHRFEVTGGVDPVVDGALGNIDCAGEHSEVVTEAVGISGLGSSLALLRSVMPGVVPIGAGLGGIHQGIANRQLRRSVVLSGLVDEADHLLPYLQVVRQAGAVYADGNFRCSRDFRADRQCHAPAFPSAVGCGDHCGSRPLGDSHPEGQHLLHRHRVRVAGGDGVLCTTGADDEAAALSHLQGTALVAAHPDRRGLRCRGGDGETDSEGGCRQRGGNAFFHAVHAVHTFSSCISYFVVLLQAIQYWNGVRKSSDFRE